MAIVHCLLLVFLYASPVVGQPIVFHTNCSRPASGSIVNFVTAPNTRGTLDILWISVFTLVICTWTIQHLSVPPQDLKFVASLWRRVRWMLFAMVVPEFLLAMALSDFGAARASLRNMQSEFPELVKQGRWSITHAFYANMGGFVLREMIMDEPDMLVNDPKAAGRSNEQEISTVAAATTPTGITFRPMLAMHSAHIIQSLGSGLLSFSPSFITEDEIQDKSKGDIFLKLTAAFQALWVIVQVCARAAQKLSTSQLEIAVLAFCVCAFGCYLAWMKKPQQVGVPTYLDAARPTTTVDQWNLSGPFGGLISKQTGTNFCGHHSPYGKSKLVFSNAVIWTYADADVFSQVGMNEVGLGVSIGATVFGAIHLLAWNLHFPTEIEKILWRISSILTTAIPPVLPMILWIFRKSGSNLRVALLLASLSLLVAYGASRVFIMVEVFRSLGFLPAEAFVGTWSREFTLVKNLRSLGVLPAEAFVGTWLT